MGTKTKIALLCMTSWALGACEKELVSDEPIDTESSVSVITRSINEEETISLPVDLYVFNYESKEFIRHERITDKESPFSFSLPKGNYSVYAIGGANEDLYIFPKDEEVTEESEIVLKKEKEHADLMTTHKNIELSEEKNYELTLNMERQVVELSDVTIQDIPDDISSVSFYLSSCFRAIKINGELSTDSIQYHKLINEGGGVWRLPHPVMTLLNPDSVSIHISMTKDNGTVKEYTYQCTEDLIKNHQIFITATYQENVNITGSITGSSWTGTKDITFIFGDNITKNNEIVIPNNETIINETTPNPRTSYKDCYVLKVDSSKEDYNEVILLHKKDFNIDPAEKTESEVLNEIEDNLSQLTVNDISGWRLPNYSEVDTIIKEHGAFKSQGASIGSDYYLFLDNEQLKLFISERILIGLTYEFGTVYRPVTILKFKK